MPSLGISFWCRFDFIRRSVMKMRQASRYLVVLLLSVVLMLVASTASAQRAEIAGVVHDSSGAVLPGVTVEAASPALIEKTRVVYTDGAGQYRVIALSPGEYK